MMKNTILLLLCAAFLSSEAQQTLTLKGHMRSLVPGDVVYLRKWPLDGTADSVSVTKKKFSFEIPLDTGHLYVLQIRGKVKSSSILLYLQPGHVNVQGKADLEFAHFSGSTFIQDFNRFNQAMKKHPVMQAFEVVNKQYTDAYWKKDTALQNKLIPVWRARSGPADSLRTALSEQWIALHPKSDINAFILFMYLYSKKNQLELEQLLSNFSEAAANGSPGLIIRNSIAAARNTAIGKIAPDFTQLDPQGNPVSLSNYRGQYVLVDFWASWCGPCRLENPAVLAAYNQFKDKNFTILGISLDNNREKWLEAIEKDGLCWQQVSDLQFWQNAVAKQYDIQSIPANLLIDPSGKIIARNLRGEALKNKLEELLR